MNTNNDVKWRKFIVPKKVEKINDHLFILIIIIHITIMRKLVLQLVEPNILNITQAL